MAKWLKDKDKEKAAKMDKVVTPTAETDVDGTAPDTDFHSVKYIPTVEEGKVRRATLDGPQESDVLLVEGEPGNPQPFEGRHADDVFADDVDASKKKLKDRKKGIRS